MYDLLSSGLITITHDGELPSVPELHRVVSDRARLADFTADREFHPAPKVIYSVARIISPGKMGVNE